jgi:Zn-dependent protease
MPAASTKDAPKLFGMLSLKEAWGLAVSLLVSSLVFAYDFERPFSVLGALPAAFAAVAIAMVVHEFVQRRVAKKLGVSAAYEMWLPGVVFSLLMMLIGIKIIAVGGAVVLAHRFSRWGMRERHASIDEIGIVSMAGPAANLLLATVLMPFAGASGLGAAAGYVATISAMLALYNLIPMKQIDGGGVMLWSFVYWLLALIWAVMLLTPSGLLAGVLTFA